MRSSVSSPLPSSMNTISQSGRDPVQDREDAPAEQIDVAALVVDRDDDADFGRSHGGVLGFPRRIRADCALPSRALGCAVPNLWEGWRWARPSWCSARMILPFPRGKPGHPRTGRDGPDFRYERHDEPAGWPGIAPALSGVRGRIGIGLHLNLTFGAPLGPCPSLAPGGPSSLEDLLPDLRGPRTGRARCWPRSSASSTPSSRPSAAPPPSSMDTSMCTCCPGQADADPTPPGTRASRTPLAADPSDGCCRSFGGSFGQQGSDREGPGHRLPPSRPGRGLRHQRGFSGYSRSTSPEARAGVLPGLRRPRSSPGGDVPSGPRRRRLTAASIRDRKAVRMNSPIWRPMPSRSCWTTGDIVLTPKPLTRGGAPEEPRSSLSCDPVTTGQAFAMASSNMRSTCSQLTRFSRKALR